MADATASRSRLLRLLPPQVQAELRERTRRLLSGARGRVYDLAGAEAHLQLYGEVDEVDEVVLSVGDGLDEGVAAGERFDTVVSVMHLARVSDPGRILARVRDVLRPGGEILFLEPVRQPGWVGRGQRLARPTIRAMTGWWLDHDLATAIRNTGLTITDIERIVMPRYVWPVRAFVQGAASEVRAPVVDGPGR